MPQARFQLQGIVHRGYPIAHIKDTRAGRDCWVYEKKGKLVHAPADNESLRRVAWKALKGKPAPSSPAAVSSGEQMSLAGVGA